MILPSLAMSYVRATKKRGRLPRCGRTPQLSVPRTNRGALALNAGDDATSDIMRPSTDQEIQAPAVFRPHWPHPATGRDGVTPARVRERTNEHFVRPGLVRGIRKPAIIRREGRFPFIGVGRYQRFQLVLSAPNRDDVAIAVLEGCQHQTPPVVRPGAGRVPGRPCRARELLWSVA